ncbi:Flp pilus assembly protein CpaB [Lichenicoccus roseus]|uniref:Flp pilus assembly protein CpaB n=1 Tax=Lichenicoccus roseus TaxID=2683649 RepID=A0A5R9J9G4_9PROT|nr:Flp pilus assembly protein CpaB [Lichenicoccus roseus]TLU70868.1 Flp pilus assembly protein CpaB [Lichenicoccus roseus]
MLLRIALFALMAIGLAGFGAVTWRATHLPPPPPPVMATARVAPPPPPVTASVLVAASNLQGGSFLHPDDVTTATLEKATLPANVELDTKANRASLNGALVRHSLTAAQTLTSADVILPGEHGFVAAILAPGMRAIMVGSEQIAGDTALLSPGDRVDIILTDVQEEISGSKLALARKILAETVLTNVRILSVDQQLVQRATVDKKASQPGLPVGPGGLTLEVTPLEAEHLVLALKIGKIALALRPAETSAGSGIALARADLPGRAPPPPVRAGDVMHSLNAPTDLHGAISAVRVYDSSGEKDFQF